MHTTLPPWVLTGILALAALCGPTLLKGWLDYGQRQEVLVRELQLKLVQMECTQRHGGHPDAPR